MANVFNATQKHGGSFKATDMVMLIAGEKMAGHVVQQITMQYQQQISTLFEIGSNNVYYIGGRAQGSLNLARVAGPEILPGIIITAFNDICNPGTLKLTSGSAQCKPGQSASANGVSSANYELGGVLITSIGISTQAQDVVVNESMSFQFLDLEVGPPTPAGAAPVGAAAGAAVGGIFGGVAGAAAGAAVGGIFG